MPQFYPDIFLIGGGSNASGRGPLASLPIFANYTKVHNYNNAAKWVYAAEPIDNATGTVDTVSDDVGAPLASGGMSFANSLYNLRPGRHVALVPCAKGSSFMDHWARDLGRSTLYGSMVARAGEAAASGALKGLIFYVMAADAQNSTLANAWAAKFTQFVADIKSDLGSTMKFVVVGLGPNPVSGLHPNWGTLDTNFNALTLPSGVARATASDLTVNAGDELHFDTVAQVTIGQRCATAMAALLA